MLNRFGDEGERDASAFSGAPVEAPVKEKTEAEKLKDIITEMADLPDIEYELKRTQVAEEYNVRTTFLDKCRKQQTSDGDAKGTEIKLYEPEPWPDAVNGAEVLDEAVALITKHMIIREVDAYACVLWAVHTHIFTGFNHSPRLLIDAPDAECGKTLLMTHMVGNLVNKPQTVELMKPAPFFRMAQDYKPTFLIDEMDVFIQEDSELLAAVNNGWEPHGGVLRCTGDDHEVRQFSTFTPVAMAGIRLCEKLPATTISRSVVIHLERASLEEADTIKPYDARTHKSALLDVGRKIARWCGDESGVIVSQRPEMPESIRNRLANKWEPLLAVALAAGGHWPSRAHKALMSRHDVSEKSRALELLEDIREAFDTDDRLHTADLIDRLCKAEDSPWTDYNFRSNDSAKRRISDMQLAKLIAPYGIKPKQIKYAGRGRKGYMRDQFEKSWARYLSFEVDTPFLPETPKLSINHAGYSHALPETKKNEVSGRAPRKPNGRAKVSGFRPGEGYEADNTHGTPDNGGWVGSL